MIKYYFFVGIICTLSLISSCKTPQKQSSISFDKNQEVIIIDFDKARKLLSEGAIFVDNRPENKYNKGHIDGAVNLPYFKPNHSSNLMTKEKLLQTIGNKNKVVFYCTGYKRAYYALKQAQAWKIDKELFWYQKGYIEWSQISR